MLACHYLQHFGYLSQFFLFFYFKELQLFVALHLQQSICSEKKKGLIYNYLAYIDFD